MTKILIVMIAIAASLVGGTNTAVSQAHCSNIASNAERLECYDKEWQRKSEADLALYDIACMMVSSAAMVGAKGKEVPGYIEQCNAHPKVSVCRDTVSDIQKVKGKVVPPNLKCSGPSPR